MTTATVEGSGASSQCGNAAKSRSKQRSPGRSSPALSAGAATDSRGRTRIWLLRRTPGRARRRHERVSPRRKRRPGRGCSSSSPELSPPAVRDERARVYAGTEAGVWAVLEQTMPESLRRQQPNPSRITSGGASCPAAWCDGTGAPCDFNTASATSLFMITKWLAYTVSKHGLIGLTRSLALDWGQYDLGGRGGPAPYRGRATRPSFTRVLTVALD